MLPFLVSSLSMYMFTINQNMKVPFQLIKGSSLDLYAIVPGMSVIFSSTYNLNITVSTKYSNVVYQTPEFSKNENSTRKNLKSVNFGYFTGRIHVVALDDTSFVYETVRGEYDKNQTYSYNEEIFNPEEKKEIEPPQKHHEFPGDHHGHFPPHQDHPQEKPGDHHHGHQGNHQDHHNGHQGNHQDHHNGQHPPPRNQKPGDNKYPNPPNSQNPRLNLGYNEESYADLIDSIVSLFICFSFIFLLITLVVSMIRACRRNKCCSYSNLNNSVDDSSIPPIIEQGDDLESYIPPSNQRAQHPRQNHVVVNYPQIQPVPSTPSYPQNNQPVQPNYYYPQQPVYYVQQPVQQFGYVQQPPQ